MNIKEYLEKLIAKKMKNLNLSSKSLTSLEEKIKRKIDQNPMMNLQEQEELIRYELKTSLVSTILRNPNSKLTHLLIDDYQEIYFNTNEHLHLPNNAENYSVFVNLVILFQLNIEADSIKSYLMNYYKKEILKANNSTKKNVKVTPKSSKKASLLIERTFLGNKKALYQIIAALNNEHKKYIKSIFEESDIKDLEYHNAILESIKRSSCFYYLLNYQYQNSADSISELNKIYQRNTFSKDLKNQQEKFYNSLGLTFEEGKKELIKIKEENEEEYIKLNIFLGNQYDKGEFSSEDIIASHDTLKKRIKKRLLEKRSKRRFLKPRLFYILERYQGDKKLLYDVIKALDETSQSYLQENIERNKIDLENDHKIMSKVEKGIRCYFLLKWKYSSFAQVLKELSVIINEENFDNKLKELQEEFFNSLSLNLNSGLEEVKKVQSISAIDYEYIMIFLGSKQYTIENPEQIIKVANRFANNLRKKQEKKKNAEISNSIIENLKKYPELYRFLCEGPSKNAAILNELLKNKSIILKREPELININLKNKFPNNTVCEIKFAIEKMKYTNPKYYNIIIKRYGVNLLEDHKYERAEKEDFNNAIARIRSLLKHTDLKQGFILAKKELNTSKENLQIIKSRRKQMNTESIAAQYQKSVIEIYQLFAEKLLLFGSLVPDIIIEIINKCPSGIDLLLESEHFKFLVGMNSKKENACWLNALDLEDNDEVVIKLQKYLGYKNY